MGAPCLRRQVGARVSWYYWINFPLWIASLAVLFPSTLGAMAGIELGLVPSLAIELAFIWIIIFISFSRASDAIWIMNVAAVLKVAIACASEARNLLCGNFGIRQRYGPGNVHAVVRYERSCVPLHHLFNFLDSR